MLVPSYELKCWITSVLLQRSLPVSCQRPLAARERAPVTPVTVLPDRADTPRARRSPDRRPAHDGQLVAREEGWEWRGPFSEGVALASEHLDVGPLFAVQRRRRVPIPVDEPSVADGGMGA